MASSQSLLVVLLFVFAHNNLINGSPVDTSEDSDNVDADDLSYNIDDTNEDESNIIIEGGLDEIKSYNEDQTGASDESKNDTSEGNSISSVGLHSEEKGVTFGNTNFNAAINGGITTGNGFSISSHPDSDSTSTVVIDGRGVYAEISGMTSLSSKMFDNRSLIGDDNKMVWNEKPGEIVVIEGGKCDKKTFEEKVEVSSETLSATECNHVLNKVNKINKDAQELQERLSKMGQNIEESVQQRMADTFYPGFPFAPRPGRRNNNVNNNFNYNGNGMSYNDNNNNDDVSFSNNGIGTMPMSSYDNNNNNGISTNINNMNGNSMSNNEWPFGTRNNPFNNRRIPFGSEGSPFTSGQFPFGPINSPFSRWNRNSGRTGNNFGAFFSNNGNSGIHSPGLSPSYTDDYGNTAVVNLGQVNGPLIPGRFDATNNAVTDDYGSVINNDNFGVNGFSSDYIVNGEVSRPSRNRRRQSNQPVDLGSWLQ